MVGAVGCVIASCITITSCSKNKSPVSPIVNGFKIDGSNWEGRSTGTLKYEKNEASKTVTYTGNRGYVANDLIIPAEVVDKGVKYNVVEIGNDTFLNCFTLTGSLIIPNSVSTIGDCAFDGCSGLTGGLMIPDGVQIIGSYAFGNCLGLTGDLVIPNNVTTIGDYAFYNLGCSDIRLNSTWNYSAFTIWWKNGSPITNLMLAGKTWSLDHVFVDDWRSSDRKIDGSNWGGRTAGTLVDEKDDANQTVKYIGRTWNYAADDLIIPDKVVDGSDEYIVAEIGEDVFYDCFDLTGSLTIGNNVTKIGMNAFTFCSNLTGDLIIPDSITIIENGAFYDLGCSKVYLSSSWDYQTFIDWWKGGAPDTDLTLGDQTWTLGNIYVDGNPY